MPRRKRSSGQKSVSSDSDELKSTSDLVSKPETMVDEVKGNQKKTAEVSKKLLTKDKLTNLPHKRKSPAKAKTSRVRKAEQKVTGKKSPPEAPIVKTSLDNKDLCHNNKENGKRMRKASGQHLTVAKGKRRRITSGKNRSTCQSEPLYDAMDIINKHEEAAKTEVSRNTNASMNQPTVHSDEPGKNVSENLENKAQTGEREGTSLSPTKICVPKKSKSVIKRNTGNGPGIGIRVLQKRVEKRCFDPKLKDSQRLKAIALSFELEGRLSNIDVSPTKNDDPSPVVNGFNNASRAGKGAKGKSPKIHRRSVSAPLLVERKPGRKRKSVNLVSLDESESVTTECDEKTGTHVAKKKGRRSRKSLPSLPSLDDDAACEEYQASETIFKQTKKRGTKQVLGESIAFSGKSRDSEISPFRKKRSRKHKTKPLAFEKDKSVVDFSVKTKTKNGQLENSSLPTPKQSILPDNGEDGGTLPELHTSVQSCDDTILIETTTSLKAATSSK